jgi:hypothetical protein
LPPRITIAVLAACLAAAATMATAAEKQPWQMTVEEHAATRVAHNVEAPGNTAAGFSDGKPVVVLDGSKNPAAFMPSELFNHLLVSCYLTNPDVQKNFRMLYGAAAVSQGIGKNLFAQLDKIVAPFIASQRAARAAAMAGDQAATKKAADTDCRDRADALQAAYAAFGHDQFQRFLYQGVAPSSALTGEVATTKQLLWIEGGCQ